MRSVAPHGNRRSAVLALAVAAVAFLATVLVWATGDPAVDGVRPDRPARAAAGEEPDAELASPESGGVSRGVAELTADTAPASDSAPRTIPDPERSGGEAVRFRIVRDEDGAPLEGATVTAIGASGKRVSDPIASDADGWVEVPPGAPGLHRVEAEWRVRADLPDLGRFAGGEVRLDPAGALVATVPGVQERDRVTFSVLRGATRAEPGDAPRSSGTITSRDHGDGLVVRIEGLECGRYHVQALSAGTVIGEEFDVQVDAGAVTRVILERGPCATLVGEVVSIEAGAPLEHVRVRRTRAGIGATFYAASSGIGQRSDTTDAAGRFELPRTPIGPVTLALALPDGTSVTREVVVREGQESRVVRLRARGAATVRGRIGEGLRGAEGPFAVLALALGDVPQLRLDALDHLLLADFAPASTRCTADGLFELRRVPTARPLVLVAISRSSDMVGVLEIDEPLGEGESLEGLVVPAIEGRTVRLTLLGPDGSALLSADGLGQNGRISVETAFVESIAGRSTQGERALSLPTGPVVEVRSRTPGATQLQVRVNGFGAEVVELTPGVEEYEVTLRREQLVEVVVVDDRGRAIPRALVVADAVGAGSDEPGARVERRTRPVLGRAHLRLDPARAWVLSASAAGHESASSVATIPAGSQPEGPVMIELQRSARPPSARITGRLVRAGRGKPVYDVTFRGIGRARAIVDGAEFDIRGLEPGPVDIVVDCGGYELIEVPVEALRPGEVRDVGELRARGATDVAVRVTDEAGVALPGARAWLERLPPPSGGRADLPERVELTSRGALQAVDRVGRATWRLRVTHPGKAPVARDVVLDRRTVRLDVTMKDT